MHETTYESLMNLLNSVDTKDRYDNTEITPDTRDIENIYKTQITYEILSILGYDIYQYSQYDLPQQSLIPFVFDLIYKEAIRHSVQNENMIFKAETFSNNFIPTGDGGFIVFSNPLEAIVFNAIFIGLLHTFNSYRLYPKLREYIGPITIRSCLTTDNLYHYANNYYGPAIISNARIISKDKLNRFLIDENTNQWFQKKFNGIENLSEITVEDIKEAITVNINDRSTSLFFCTEDQMPYIANNRKLCRFKNCHLQKIGSISVKANKMSIYNIELQSFMYYTDELNPVKGKYFTVSIGNLNCTGIGEI